MAFRFGLSEGLHKLSPLVPLVQKGHVGTLDTTLFLLEEDEQWIRSKTRQLRPVFVRDIAEARKVIHDLEEGLEVDRFGSLENEGEPE